MSSGFGRGIHPMAISDICQRSQLNFFDLLESEGVESGAVIDNTVGMFEPKRALFEWQSNDPEAAGIDRGAVGVKCSFPTEHAGEGLHKTANRHVNEVHIFEVADYTFTLAKSLQRQIMVAIPDRYMETYTDFLSRLSDNNALGRRVTVVPHDIKEKPNPPQCAPKDFKYALGRADLMDVTSSADEIESIVARADR
eukprot:jgi/Bigna1/134689/aug1.26_g9397